MKTRALLLCALPLVLAAATARADEPDFTDVSKLRADVMVPEAATHAKRYDDMSSFPYTRQEDKHYLRAALEVTAILVVGNVDYVQNVQARGGTVRTGDPRWALNFDWPTFHDKLTGDYWKVDTNHFNTNYISHPFAGTNYYTAARSNHLSVYESFGYAAVGALAWEYFGELREEVSINDAIVTEVAGMGIGEPLMQMRSFFRRSKDNVGNNVLAVLMSPIGAINDLADGARLERSAPENLDALGFTKDVSHRFEVFAGGGPTWQGRATSASPRAAYGDMRFGLDTELRNLPHAGYYDDGNVTSLRIEATTWNGGRLGDMTVETHLSPLGIYTRAADGSASSLLGVAAGFEYSVHEFDRDGTRPRDLLTLLSPVGAVGEHEQRVGDLTVKTRLEILAEFAGVTAYALDDYRAVHNRDDTNLQTVLRQEGYYHAYGVATSPLVTLGYGPFEVGGRARLETWRGIEGRDENQERIAKEIPLSDQRIMLRTHASARVPGTPLLVEGAFRRSTRVGEVGEVRASRSETQILGTVGALF
jgi:hypothetical protein